MTDAAPRSIERYLDQLRSALAGEDPALIQDALYDVEEYLRAEIAGHPDKSEPDVLELIASTYGAPAEVAEVYRSREQAVAAALSPPVRREHRSRLGRWFGVLVDPRAYAALFYMLLGLATGIIYFTVATTGISLSIGLMVLIVGIPFTLLFLALARVLSLTEGRLVEVMLGVRMPRRPRYEVAGRTFLTRIKELVTDRRTWTTLLYLLLMLPLGITYFVTAASTLAFSVSLVVGPIVRLLEALGMVRGEVSFIEGLPLWAMPLVLLAGVFLLPLCLRLYRAIGGFHGRLAKALLVY